jgi:hypothetical protein
MHEPGKQIFVQLTPKTKGNLEVSPNVNENTKLTKCLLIFGEGAQLNTFHHLPFITLFNQTPKPKQ